MLQTVKSYLDAGLSIVPIAADGTKRPNVREWKTFQTKPAGSKTIQQWFGAGGVGVGIIGGAVSGNLEILDFDDPATAEKWWQELQEFDPDLAQRLVVVRTPSDGRHIYYRCEEPVDGNKKLAQRLGIDGRPEVLIETRGEGGYAIAPPSPAGCHPSNQMYALEQGDLLNLPVISARQRLLLLGVSELFNELRTEKKPAAKTKSMTPPSSSKPGEEYALQTSWEEILEPQGWTVSHSREETTYWRRPGKSDQGVSATTNHGGSDLLYVFSSNASPFEPNQSYNKFGAYATLNHNADFNAAAKALAASGFGTPFDEPPATNGAPEQWLDPIPFDVQETPDIPSSLLPAVVGHLVSAVADSTQTPCAMAVMMSLAVLATCAQKRFEVHVAASHIEPLALWVLVALPPASRKTAVLNELMRPIEEWERDTATEFRPVIFEQEAQREVAKQREGELLRRAGKEEDKHERMQLEHEIAKLKEEMATPLLTPRLWTGDTTPERLQGLLADHGERMAVLSDEGGIFEVMAGMYSDGKANLDVFLKSHSGSAVRVDRAGRTVYLSKPALTFGLTVQPAVVADLCNGDKRRFRGIGTLARFLYCLPKSNIGSRDVRRHKEIPSELYYRYDACIRDLLSVQAVTDADGSELPRRLTLSPEALDAFYVFADEIENQQCPDGLLEPVQDWSGKLPGAAARIAGLTHLAQHGSDAANHTTISGDTMRDAVALCRLLIPHALAAFDLMGTDPAFEDAKYILKWLVRKPITQFRKNELNHRPRFKNSKVTRLERALEILAARNVVSDQQQLPTRKPTLIYYVNPKIYS